MFKTPQETAMDLARRVKLCRKQEGLTLAEISKASNITLSTYRRFEREGKISLDGLLKLAVVFKCLDAFDKLFQATSFKSIDDIGNEN